MTRNVAALADPPRMTRAEVPEPYTPAGASAFLRAIAGHRLEAQWIVYLTTGLRRGQALGLLWADLDLAGGMVWARHAAQRVEGELRTDEEAKTEDSAQPRPLARLTVRLLLQIQRGPGGGVRVSWSALHPRLASPPGRWWVYRADGASRLPGHPRRWGHELLRAQLPDGPQAAVERQPAQPVRDVQVSGHGRARAIAGIERTGMKSPVGLPSSVEAGDVNVCSRQGLSYVDDMSPTERAALLLLLRESGGQWSSVTEEVEERGSALAVLAGDRSGQMSFFDGVDGDRLNQIEEEIAAWEREGMRFVTLLDPDYPAQLLTIHQRSPFVMWRGTPMADDARGVAVVGTRHPGPDGLRQAENLAYDLARRGVTVISGLAAGIDTAAHTGALRAGGRTVAVIGTGLRRAYPRENEALQERISREGLVLSQFLPDTPPTPKTFPMRNATMSGYAAATVVVEATWKSGARMQARLALEHGRRVFLLQSLLQHDWARDYARRPGASVVADVDDVIGQLEAITAPRRELTWA